MKDRILRKLGNGLRAAEKYANTTIQLMRLEAENVRLQNACSQLASELQLLKELPEAVNEILGDHGMFDNYGVNEDQDVLSVICDVCTTVVAYANEVADERATNAAIYAELEEKRRQCAGLIEANEELRRQVVDSDRMSGESASALKKIRKELNDLLQDSARNSKVVEKKRILEIAQI